MGLNVGGEPKGDISRLRRRASAIGITIRTHRRNGTSEQRAYSLVDRVSGRVLYGEIATLMDVDAVLSRIVWDRQRPDADAPSTTTVRAFCPMCGTPRVGQFRWCRSCGHDFEASSHVAVSWPPFRLPEPETDASRKQPIDASRLPAPADASALLSRANPPDGHRRWLEVGIAVGDRLPSLPIRYLGIGALIGLLVGAITAVLLSLR